MHDQPDNQHPETDRIHLCSRDEARRWCDEFQCTELELRGAVYAVGGQPQRVREYLHPPLRQKLARVLRWFRASDRPANV